MILAATPPAIHAPATPAAASSGLDWILDDDLAPRATAARADAAAQKTAAANADQQRTAELAKQQSADAEKAELFRTLGTLSGKKKTQADARMAELDAASKEAAARALRFAGEAAAARARAAADESFATKVEAEDKLRKAQAVDRIDPDAELGGFSDLQLSKAKAWWKRTAARAPVQIAALEKQIDIDQTQGGRASLMARADAVRAQARFAQAQQDRLDEELRFRGETKADESDRAAEVLAAAQAKVTDTPMEAMTMSSARSAALDRKLDEIAAAKETEAADADAARRSRRFWMRTIGALATVAAAAALIVVMLKRSA
jgi:hypothetical protein